VLYLGMIGGLSELAFQLWLLVMGVSQRAPVMVAPVRVEQTT
jgi:hypothetical protein